MKKRKQYTTTTDETTAREIAGTKSICVLKDAIKRLQGELKVSESQFKERVLGLFRDQGSADKIESVEGDASATIILGKRSTRSPLSPEECKFLEANGIEPELDEKVGFKVNPKYFEDEKVMSEVFRVIARNKKLPADLIKQEEDRYVVPAGAIEAAMGNEDVLKVVSNVSIKARYDGNSIQEVAR